MNTFEPSTIGPMTLPNRLLMAPVKPGFGTPDGTVTEQQISYFRRRAEGGVGAIIVEPVIKLSLSADHRVTDGAQAGRFYQTLRELLEGPDCL